MNCGYKEKTLLYFYGELPAAGSAEVKAHLESCRSCAADLSVLKALSEDLSSLRPMPPELDVYALCEGFRDAQTDLPVSGFLRSVLAGALAALFLAAFHIPVPGGSPSGWQGDIDSGLENLESRIYTLEDEIVCPVYADFDYAYSDLETRKEQADERA